MALESLNFANFQCVPGFLEFYNTKKDKKYIITPKKPKTESKKEKKIKK